MKNADQISTATNSTEGTQLAGIDLAALDGVTGGCGGCGQNCAPGTAPETETETETKPQDMYRSFVGR